MEFCECCGQPLPGWGNIKYDEETRIIEYQDREAYLTECEMIVFTELHKAQGLCRNKYGLHTVIYGNKPECDWVDIKIIDVFICKLRKKIRPLGLTIKSHWGVGYSLDKPIDYSNGEI